MIPGNYELMSIRADELDIPEKSHELRTKSKTNLLDQEKITLHQGLRSLRRFLPHHLRPLLSRLQSSFAFL